MGLNLISGGSQNAMQSHQNFQVAELSHFVNAKSLHACMFSPTSVLSSARTQFYFPWRTLKTAETHLQVIYSTLICHDTVAENHVQYKNWQMHTIVSLYISRNNFITYFWVQLEAHTTCVSNMQFSSIKNNCVQLIIFGKRIFIVDSQVYNILVTEPYSNNKII